MKAKIILSTIALAALLLCSCEKLEFGNEFLEKDDSGADVTKDTIFNSYLYANRYLSSAYFSLPYGLPNAETNKGFKMAIDILESLTDLNHTYSLTWGTVNKTYYNMAYNATIESVKPFETKYSFSGRGNWAAIRTCWNIIENADRIPPDDKTPAAILKRKEQIKMMKGEARMIIALHYCDMYRHYGGLPWVDRTYAATEIPQLKRLTSLETLNKIVALIEEAEDDLPWAIANKNDDGRFTKAAAIGLKARILLFGASPLFNNASPYLEGEASSKFYTWHGGYDASLWRRAAEASKELLDQAEANGYKLVNTGNYRKDFQDAYYKRGNGEVLISTRVRFAGLDFWNRSYIFTQAASEYGIAHPTKEYVDMFPMANGLKTTDVGSGFDKNYPYANRDPRLYETVLVNGDPQYQGRTAEMFQVGDGNTSALNGSETRFGAPLTRTGFKIRKFLLDTDRFFATNTRGLPVHWPYLRLAEIYLSYAEALNEVNGGPTAEAYEAVNMVRNRVGLGNLKTGLSKDQFTEEIITERALEFGYEEVRWYDLVRRKMDKVFTKKLHGEITIATNPAKTTFRYETKELPKRGWTETFSPKWYLSAFPATEVNKGYGLIQNPGW
jgi:starch-binding outer membrane protein, SusD/RagB family